MTAVDEVLRAAADVARAPADQPKRHVFAAGVPWTRIQRLRDALDALGMEWRDDRHKEGPHAKDQ